MTRTGVVAAGLLLKCLTVAPCAQVPGSARTIDVYHEAIRAALEAPSGGRIEVAFNAIGPLREALLQTGTSARSDLEAMTESAFLAVRRELGMVGVMVHRDEVLYVEPDVHFFRALAARGDRVDRAFFDAFHSTYPESVFPVYLQQQTDYSGCTRFGSGTLVSTYLAWSGFRREYPTHYNDASATELAKVSRQLTDSTCACGDAASVEQEFVEFIHRATVSPLRARVERRLVAVRRNPATIRFGCLSG